VAIVFRQAAVTPRWPSRSLIRGTSPTLRGNIELVVDDHLVVRVPDGFDSETLRRVLAVATDGGER